MTKATVISAVKNFFKTLWSSVSTFFAIIYRNKKAFAGLIILCFFVLLALIGAIFLQGEAATSYEGMYLGASWKHPLGTDNMGRDLLYLVVKGTKDVLSIAFLTACFTIAFGLLIGMVSGLAGGWVDKILQLITDVFMSIPSFPVIMILASVITIQDSFSFALVLSVFSWGGLSRAIRSQIVSLKERDFIQICYVMNLSFRHITFKELLPNIFSFIAINFISSMKNAITGSVGIMLMGLAVFEPANWGAIIINAKDAGALVIPSGRWALFVPIAAIALFQMGALLFANGLDDAINPRLRN